jgi:hypothetical protein
MLRCLLALACVAIFAPASACRGGGGRSDGDADGDADAGGDGDIDADGGACASDARCAHPPEGYEVCGGGLIDPTASVAACEDLDPPTDLSIGAQKECSVFAPVSGRYEVYCGADGVYVWVLFDELTSTSILHCTFDVELPDGGVVTADSYELLWDLLYVNTTRYYSCTSTPDGGEPQRLSGMAPGSAFLYREPPEAESPELWRGQYGVDLLLGAATPAADVTGAIYIETVPVDCDGIPDGQGAIVLAVPVEWSTH